MTRSSPHLIVFATMALLLATPAHAQTAGSGCPPPSAIEENDQITVGRTWLPMRIGIDVAKATCRVHDFMVDFFKRQPDPDKASLDDYIEASKPDDGNGGDQKYRAKLRDMPSPTKNPGWNPNPATSIVVLPPNASGGVPVLFQANAPDGPTPTSVAEIQGNGTLLSAEGMKRGTFVKGKLNGVGEEIDPNGTWRSGTYESGRNMGQVWEVRKVAGKTYLASGSVVNGKLDGMIERIFADGSTQFEDWEGGKLMQVGVRAPKGQSAMAPQARYKPVEEAEMEDAYKHTGPRTKIAPGTTFDPARTTRAAKPLTFEQAFSEYRTSCEGIVLARYESNKYNQPDKIASMEEDFQSAGIENGFAINLFKANNIDGYVESMKRNARGLVAPQSNDTLGYLSYGLAICAVNVRMRQLGLPPLPFVG